ncbi:MAG: ATP-binding protein [Clostridiaceae bacterium]
MKKGLFTKMALAYTVIIAGSFIVLASVLSIWFEGYYFDQRKNQLNNEAKIIEPSIEEYLNRELTSDSMSDLLSYISNYIYADIWIADSNGYLYAVSDIKHENLIGKQVLTEDLVILRKGKTVEKRGTFNSIFSLPVHTYEMPIIIDGYGFSGTIIMNTSLDEIQEPLKKVYFIIWISALFAILSSTFVIYYFSQKIIIKPLGKINEASYKLAQGDVSKRVYIKSNDEIGELAKSFNSMADSLEKVEKNRKDFISNVSHELRSPITSINGFIGGILDGVIPKEKEVYYLNVTHNEIQRLSRLINDLLDLSAIESGKLTLNITKFNMVSLIKETAVKFERRLINKNVKMKVLIKDDNIFVEADKDRIIQVITNLLDNAVKCVSLNGNIIIKADIKGDKVYISIYNDSKNISEETMKHIFDRFYKGDKSRTNKESTGLGLSIARSILISHNNEIWIKNEEKGVEFTFSLNRAK